MQISNEQYIALRETFKGQRLPLAFVDFYAFDDNLPHFVADKGAH